MRTGGAALLAAQGVNPFKIQSLGRWASPLVIHYAGEAMASGVAADIAAHGPVTFRRDSKLLWAIRKIEDRIDALEAGPPIPTEPCRDSELSRPGRLLDNVETRVFHWSIYGHTHAEQHHKTICGWQDVKSRCKYGVHKFACRSEFPANIKYNQLCDRCLPQTRHDLRTAQDALSDCE